MRIMAWGALLIATAAPPLAYGQTDDIFRDGFECAGLPATHVGCEFYAVPLANTGIPGPPPPFMVGLANTSTADASVVITGGALGGPLPLTIAPGDVSVTVLPLVASLQTVAGSARADGGAYHIVSDRPLTAYQYNGLGTGSADASLLLPVHALSGHYRVAGWPSWDQYPGFLAVVATADGTTVTVSPTATVLAGGGLTASGGTVVLNRGDVVQVLAATPGSGHPTFANDLSGSVVTADKRVAVFGGHDLSQVPLGVSYADHLEEQLPPTETLGTDFVVAVPAKSADPRHFVKLVGNQDSTQLTYAPSTPPGAPTNVNAGQVVTFEAISDFQMTASHPLVVAQYLEGGQGYLGDGVIGDPSMGMVVPSSQFLPEYVFVAATREAENWITIVAPAGEAVTVDGVAVPPASFTTITGTSRAVARVSLSATPGLLATVHRVSAAAPIGVYTYGYSPANESYLSPAGMGLTGIPVDSATLWPWSSLATGSGALSESAGAGMNATPAGLQAVVSGTAGIYVQDDTPVNEDHYRARFYFDPHGFDTGEAQNHHRARIFIVFEEAPLRRLAAVVLRRTGGAYALLGRARLDGGAQADTAFVPISDGPHVVEIDWVRSSGPDASDGSFELWVDDVSPGRLTGLDNSASSVDFVRLGALSVKSGATGTMYWDEFVSRRTTYIGP